MMNKDLLARHNDAIARSPILLIDDNRENLNLLERMLDWGGFANVRSCISGQEGLDALGAFDPHLVILDLMMPGMSGYQFLERVREDVSDGSYLPILVFTADLTPEAKIRALELGASDFLTKPGDAVEIQLRLKNFLRTRLLHGELQNHNKILEAKVRQRTKHLAIARREAVELLAAACEYRDDDTGQHVRRVGETSAGIAQALGLDAQYVETILLAAPLHDVGKLAIPDSVLHKPCRLSEEETLLMRQHVPVGATILKGKTSPFLHMASEIAQFHHERWDGLGYESGLAGEAIPLCARIVTVADAFDAMTNDRPYRSGRPQSEALAELTAMSGCQFDPAVVQALYRHLRVPIPEDRIAA